VCAARVSLAIFDAQSQRLCCFHGDEPYGAFVLYNVYISSLTNIVADLLQGQRDHVYAIEGAL